MGTQPPSFPIRARIPVGRKREEMEQAEVGLPGETFAEVEGRLPTPHPSPIVKGLRQAGTPVFSSIQLAELRRFFIENPTLLHFSIKIAEDLPVEC